MLASWDPLTTREACIFSISTLAVDPVFLTSPLLLFGLVRVDPTSWLQREPPIPFFFLQDPLDNVHKAASWEAAFQFRVDADDD
jgi:hypothetical protein